jgi:molybdopterin-biosynthesis enzyme MoeA-like protein
MKRWSICGSFILRRAGNVAVTEKQCLLPDKARLVPIGGTACGFMLSHKGTYFFFLPACRSR